MDNGMERLVEGTANEAQKARKKSMAKASQKHIASHYDRVSVLIRKGIKERIQSITDESMNAYINRLIEEDLAKHKASQ